jgi:hypothetical protein
MSRVDQGLPMRRLEWVVLDRSLLWSASINCAGQLLRDEA